ncbi:MAG: SPFH domain-containing protein [Actinomycetota bacterium]|nr:SPFH domain-containing protein [Actinomycetota bacterium]
MFGYHVPAPDEAMLISGGTAKGSEAPFRVVTGRGAYVAPMFRKVRFITLSMSEAEVEENCVTKQGIALQVKAVIAFKVGNDTASIVNAAQRFLSDQSQMSVLTGRIFSGHLRSIIGSMTVEEIVTERQKLATEVLDGSKEEMAKIGLTVDALQIQSIDDMGLGYIAAMAAPHNAAIQRAAKVAASQADQAASEAQQASLRAQAEYVRQTEMVQAQYAADVEGAKSAAAATAASAAQESARNQANYEAETAVTRSKAAQIAAEAQQESDRNQADFARKTAVAKAAFAAETQAAQAKADQSGPLAHAVAQQQVIDAQTALAQQQAELARQTLVSTVIRPAEADAERVKILAAADAERTKILAEAAQSHNRVALDQQLIAQLPLIVEKAAQGLAGAHLTVLNGSEGVTEVVSSLVGQGLAILDSVKQGVSGLGESRGGRDVPSEIQIPSGR